MRTQKKNALDTRGGEPTRRGKQGKSGTVGATLTNGHIPANSPIAQEADALGLSLTGVRPRNTPDVPHTTPSVALATDEQQDAFCIKVIECDGVKAACREYGMSESAAFYHANTHPSFRAKLNVAMSSTWEKQGHALNELMAELISKDPKDMNLCANAYGRVVDYRLRILGNLNRTLYGERQAAQVNIQNNTGIVCDEETRGRLIALNQKLLSGGKAESHRSDFPDNPT